MRNKAGATLPPRVSRILERRALAKAYRGFPWDVGDAPADEVALELQILDIEARNQPAPSKQPPARKPRTR